MHSGNKNIIFTDFQGVLDDPAKVISNEALAFAVPEIACPDKVFRLTKLAIESKSDIVLTSSYRDDVNFECIAIRCLKNSENQEHKALAEKIYNDFDLGAGFIFVTEHRDSRSDEIQDFLNQEEQTGEKVEKFVVFEDYESIDEHLNPIFTDPSKGLTDEDCQKALIILGESKRKKESNLEP